jgi:hypothetical protein
MTAARDAVLFFVQADRGGGLITDSKTGRRSVRDIEETQATDGMGAGGVQSTARYDKSQQYYYIVSRLGVVESLLYIEGGMVLVCRLLDTVHLPSIGPNASSSPASHQQNFVSSR